jgi:hypothetical protein
MLQFFRSFSGAALNFLGFCPSTINDINSPETYQQKTGVSA